MRKKKQLSRRATHEANPLTFQHVQYMLNYLLVQPVHEAPEGSITESSLETFINLPKKAMATSIRVSLRKIFAF